jgi:hypothetical protein
VRDVESLTPQEAQRIVAAYLKVVEAHTEANVYPCTLDDLPQSKDTIRAAFRASVAALDAAGQLTSELRDYLEIAYVSLADYVSGECMTLLREYRRAGEELAGERRLAREKVATDAWRRLSEQSRLAGELARAISDDADRLRAEFRSWLFTESSNVDDISTGASPSRAD